MILGGLLRVGARHGVALVGEAASSAPAAAAFREASTGVAPSGTDVVIGKPASTAAGDVMIAAIADRGSSGDTITPPAGWTEVRSQVRGSVGKLSVFWKLAGASEPASYTFVCSASNTQVGAIASFRGVDAAAPVDASAGATATVSGGAHTCPAVTSTVADTLLVRIACTAVSTLPCSWTWADATERVDANSVSVGAGGITIATEPLTVAGSSGTRDATFAQTGSTTFAAVTLALAPAA